MLCPTFCQSCVYVGFKLPVLVRKVKMVLLKNLLNQTFIRQAPSLITGQVFKNIKHHDLTPASLWLLSRSQFVFNICSGQVCVLSVENSILVPSLVCEPAEVASTSIPLLFVRIFIAYKVGGNPWCKL